MTLAFFGGTFNPPHLGHIALARAAMEVLQPGRLLWVPSGAPPHKALPPETPEAFHRLAMTKLAAAELPGSEVCAAELEENLRYTADTLAYVRERYAPDTLWLLCGADMFCTIDRWREPERLFSLCHIAAFARSGDEGARMEAQEKRLRENFGAKVCLCVHDTIPLSSTGIRARIPLGQGAAGLSGAVYDYICTEKLYGVSAAESLALPLLRRNAAKRLSPHRAAHSLGVEEMAASLARHYNLSETEARQAALLHDITKEEADQLKLLESCDILPSAQTALPPYMRHAWTAAEEARRRGASADVVNAVRYHPTGRPGMSPLEAVVYLSDKIERNRPAYPGLEEIRTESRRDLRKALLLSLHNKDAYLRSRGREPGEAAAQTLAWLTRNPDCFGKVEVTR